jgi:hypothetical protein
MNSVEFAVVSVGVIYISIVGFILAKMLCNDENDC